MLDIIFIGLLLIGFIILKFIVNLCEKQIEVKNV